MEEDLFDLSRALNPSGQPTDFIRATQHALKETATQLKLNQSNHLGFHANQHIDFTDLGLEDFYQVHTINDENFTVGTNFMERAVLDYYASLWNAKTPHWGVLNSGSEEGNLYALWAAKNYLSGSTSVAKEVDSSKPIDPVSSHGQAGHGFEEPHGGSRRQPWRPGPAQDFFHGPTPHRPGPPPYAENPHKYSQGKESPESIAAKENLHLEEVLFHSVDSTNSIIKASKMIGIKGFSEVGNVKYKNQCPVTEDGVWPYKVPSTGGAIDVSKLGKMVDYFAARGHPVVVSLNYGSSFEGGYDDVPAVHDVLKEIFEKYGSTEEESESRCWIHVNGDLGASYMRYLNIAKEVGFKYKDGSQILPGPNLDFEHVNSIAMSGHKWMGSPIPTGVFMTKTKYQINGSDIPEYIGEWDKNKPMHKESKGDSTTMRGHKWISSPIPTGVFMTKTKYQMNQAEVPMYIGNVDETVNSGSRNGLSAALMWTSLSKNTLQQQLEKAVYCQEMASYMEISLKKLEKETKTDLSVERSPLSLTVRLRRLNKDLVQKYSLSNGSVNGGLYSSVFAMEHVTTKLVDQFAEDIKKQGPAAIEKGDSLGMFHFNL